MPPALYGLILRHALTILGGALVTKGILSADQVTAVATALAALGGPAAIILGVGLSVWNKYKTGQIQPK